MNRDTWTVITVLFVAGMILLAPGMHNEADADSLICYMTLDMTAPIIFTEVPKENAKPNDVKYVTRSHNVNFYNGSKIEFASDNCPVFIFDNADEEQIGLNEYLKRMEPR